ncbi:hypothetical protein EYF80_009989 [Liparis tanakae]|uniref:Uncharacterized protein n=1 Tax=Liparis tanakae TaxID=230148 RepID=A0A4Z2IPG3_9TELE|nr:hypothetical protein EYF80_009989 [Liparis tanakae]
MFTICKDESLPTGEEEEKELPLELMNQSSALLLVMHRLGIHFCPKVGKRLGGSPGLKVAGHPDGGSHLRSVHSVSGADLAARQTCALEQPWLAPAPRDPSALPTSDIRDPPPLRPNPDPCDPSARRPTPVTRRLTPVTSDPSERRPIPVTRRREGHL